jgi:hypothetical protein
LCFTSLIEQFFTAFPLGIGAVPNLEPSGFVASCQIRAKLPLRNDTFQVALTSEIEQTTAIPIDVPLPAFGLFGKSLPLT